MYLRSVQDSLMLQAATPFMESNVCLIRGNVVTWLAEEPAGPGRPGAGFGHRPLDLALALLTGLPTCRVTGAGHLTCLDPVSDSPISHS